MTLQEFREVLKAGDQDPERRARMGHVFDVLRRHFEQEPSLLHSMAKTASTDGVPFAIVAAFAFGLDVGRKVGEQQALRAMYCGAKESEESHG